MRISNVTPTMKQVSVVGVKWLLRAQRISISELPLLGLNGWPVARS